MYNFFTAGLDQLQKSLHEFDNGNNSIYSKALLTEIFKHCSLLNQLQIITYYKEFCENYTKQCGVDNFLSPYFNSTLNFYQDQLVTNANQIVNAYCPILAWYNFRST